MRTTRWSETPAQSRSQSRPYISAQSRLHLGYISATSGRDLGAISARSRQVERDAEVQPSGEVQMEAKADEAAEALLAELEVEKAAAAAHQSSKSQGKKGKGKGKGKGKR